MPVLPSFDCCGTETCDSSTVVQVPGPAGADGADGADGTDGISAYTITTGSFTMPAELANITVDVETSAPFAVGQNVFIETGGVQGYFAVSSKPSSTQLFLRNLADTPNSNYQSNSAPGTIFAAGAQVSPGGIQGPSGAGGGGGGGGGTGGLSGTGSPEGVVTADVGTPYTDLTPPYALWMKTTGSGNTGWTQFLSL